MERKMEEVFAYIESHKQDYLDELFTFLRQKSISTTNEGVRDCAALLRSIMEKAGIRTTIYETERHPVVYGEIITDPSLPTMLMYGHYDVQPPDPLELWETDPFEPVIKNNRIYCRGCSDNKAQLYAHIKGMQAYKEIYGSLPINIKYLFEGEEEIGSEHLPGFVKSHLDLLKADACIYSDGCFHENGKPILILGLKGLCYVELTLKGACRDVHSMRASCIPNPVWRMVGLLNTLKGEDGYVKLDGFYDNVRPLTSLEIETCKKIPVDAEGLKKSYQIKEFVKGRASDHYYYNLMFEPTCNIAGIVAGYIGDGAKTVIPNKVTVKIDFRLVPNQDPNEILNKLRKHLDKRGYTDVEIKHYSMVIPSRTPIDDPYVQLSAKAVEDGFGESPMLFPGVGGAGPNYIFTDYLKIPAIEIPYATADQNNHAPNECMGLDGFWKGIRTAAAVINRFPRTK